MALDILGYRDKWKKFYGDKSLEDVAKDAYTRGGYDKQYPDFDTWKKESGIDADIQADNEKRNPIKTAPIRLAKSFIEGGARGLTTELPSMVGGALEFTGSYLPGDAIEKTGKTIKDWADEKAMEWYGPEKERTGLDRIVYEGTKMLAPSIVPGGIVLKGVRAAKGIDALMTAGRIAEATKAAKTAENIASGSVAGLFGLSQAQQTRGTANQQADQLEAQGDYEGARKAREAGRGIAPIATGAIEAAGEFLGTKYLSKLFGLSEAEVAKRGTKEFAKDLLKTLGVEVSTEMGQSGGESAVEKYSGIRPDAQPIQEAIDVIGPTAFMTLLTGGLAGAANRLQSKDPKEKEGAEALEKQKQGALLSLAINEGLKTGQLDGNPFTNDDALQIMRDGRKKGMFSQEDIDRFHEYYPGLKKEITQEFYPDIYAKEQTKNSYINIIDTGIMTGKYEDTPIERGDIVSIASEGYKQGLFTPGDLDDFSKKYPGMRGEFQDLYIKSVLDKVNAEVLKPVENLSDVPEHIGIPPEGGVDENGPLQTKTEIESIAPLDTTPATGLAAQDSIEGKEPVAGEPSSGASPVTEVPIDQIKASKDVPQFKGDANEKGIVQELQGTEYRRVPMNAVILWERNNGDLEIITGRHRLDLARRLGEKTIPSQIVKESEGFDRQKALTFDAEQNILDNQGTEKDYANYFRNTEITEDEARLRGLLRGTKATSSWVLGKNATDQTFNAYFRTGEVNFKQAVAVSKAAPNDERLQLAGRSFVTKNPRATETEVENFVHALSLVKDVPRQEQGDLFGFDDSAIRTAEMQAKKAAAIIGRLRRDSSNINAAIRGEGKLELSAEGAKEYGIKNPKSKDQLRAARNKILSTIGTWEKWYVNPELVKQLTEADAPSAQTVTEPSSQAAPAKEPWQMTRDEFVASELSKLSEHAPQTTRDMRKKEYIQKHKNSIIPLAISQGKPVPPEVLKDYPGLAPKEAAPAKAPKKTLLEKAPPGGWTEADKVPEKYRKPDISKITDRQMLEAMRPGTDQFELGGVYRQKGRDEALSIIIRGIDEDGKVDGAYMHKGGLLSPAKFDKGELIPLAADSEMIATAKAMFGIKTPAQIEREKEDEEDYKKHQWKEQNGKENDIILDELSDMLHKNYPDDSTMRNKMSEAFTKYRRDNAAGSNWWDKSLEEKRAGLKEFEGQFLAENKIKKEKWEEEYEIARAYLPNNPDHYEKAISKLSTQTLKDIWNNGHHVEAVQHRLSVRYNNLSNDEKRNAPWAEWLKQKETEARTEKTDAGEQVTIPGASATETFNLTNPETEISKPLRQQVTPKNEDLLFDTHTDPATLFSEEIADRALELAGPNLDVASLEEAAGKALIEIARKARDRGITEEERNEIKTFNKHQYALTLHDYAKRNGLIKGTPDIFKTDILGRPNKFKETNAGPEDYGMKAVEKNREIVAEKLDAAHSADLKGSREEWKARMQEAIDLAEKSNAVLAEYEKQYGGYRAPYNIEQMKARIAQKETPKEDAYTAAIGVIGGGAADRIKESKYEFAYGETKEKSDTYYDMVGMFSGGKADRLIGAGITIVKKQTPAYGAQNKLVSKDEMEEARRILKEALSGINVGVPLSPQVVQAGIKIAVYHIEAGSHKFIDYASKMISDFGDVVRPYLKQFYMAAKYQPGLDASGMDTEAALNEMDDTLVTLEDKKALMGSLQKDDKVYYTKGSDKDISAGYFRENKDGYITVVSGGGLTTEVFPADIIRAERGGEPIESVADQGVEKKGKTPYEYGKEAFARGAKAIPAQDKDFLDSLAGKNGVEKDLDEWTKGWTDANLAAPWKPAVSLFNYGLTLSKGKTNNGKDVWNISGAETRTWKEYIKRAGGRWYGPRRVWSFYNGDPTEKLLATLPPINEVHPSIGAEKKEATKEQATRSILPPKDQKKGGPYYIAKLLESHNLLDEIMQGEDFYRIIKNPPYQDLVIERHGNDLYFTHYYDQNGDRIMDGEMIWTVDNTGALSLKETAVQNTIRGGELRARDNSFANIFSRNLIHQGFDRAKLVNPREEEQAPIEPSPYGAVADKIFDKLNSNTKFTRNELFEMCDQAFGGTLAEGKYSAKDAYDAMEMGINLYIYSTRFHPNAYSNRAEFPKSAEGFDDKARKHIADLKALLELVPTQTTRTEEMDEFQQFSTVPSLAFVANWVAMLNSNDVYLEPSAGTGNLAAFAKLAGVKEIIVNELAPRRAAILKELGFDQVFTENAEQLNNILPKDVKPTVVVMNPPFSATAGRMKGERKTINATVHIEQALKRLEPGGRLVAIVGEGMADGKPAFTDWWKKMEESYLVRANVGISGQEYAKYGTTFDNQIIIIDKPIDQSDKKSILKVTGKVDKVEQLIDLLKGVRDERIDTGKRDSLEQSEQEGATGTQAAPGRDGALLPATGGILPHAQPGRSGRQTDADRGRDEGVEAGIGDEVSGNVSGHEGTGRAGAVGQSKGQSQGTGRSNSSDNTRQADREASGLPTEGVEDLTVEQRAEIEKHSDELTDSVYDTYRPAKVKIPNAKEHPGKLVESAAMASVEPIDPTYSPKIPEKAVKSGSVSIAQLEAVVYAGQAHSEILPNGSRKGFFIGDGTGVGKGREIASILLDNWNHGRRKAVWISQNSPLMKDAQRDIKGIGWDPKLVFDIGKAKIYGGIQAKEGIGFVGYDTLRMKKIVEGKEVSRLNQLVNWFGKDYDGVIVFDESHNMGNALPVKGARGTTKPSARALTGIELQNLLPQARIVYVSATGATEVMNLAYAERLGLWGDKTPFPTAHSFVSSISAGGISAMEMVAMNMKANGVYMARSLAYDDVKYERLEHPLTSEQRAIYNELAKAWKIAQADIFSAMALTNITGTDHTGSKKTLNSEAKSSILAQFWGTNQRFWNQVITAMQMPSVIKTMESDVKAGRSPIVQLINTNEASQERAIGRLEEDDTLEDLDITPRDMLMEYVNNSFPVYQYETFVDDQGNEKSRMVKDSKGNPVLNAEAVEMRDALLTKIGSIRVPDGPLEMIIDHFGTDVVAEVTGRSRRVVYKDTPDGRKRVVESWGKNKGIADADAFMADKKKILVFSQAGGTGRSYHADRTAKNKRLRRHYLVQAGWRADVAVQGLGRSHRTNQEQAPEWVLVTTDLEGQKRFVSSIARRLNQLGALTKGSRETGNQGLFNARDNLESTEAKDAFSLLLRDLYKNQVPEMTMGEFIEATGLDKIIDERTGALNVSQLPTITQFLNRILNMEIGEQNKIFGEFSKRLNMKVAQAIEDGTLDVGVETIRAKRTEKINEQAVYEDEKTKAQAKYLEVELTHDAKLMTFMQSTGFSLYGYVQNIKSGRIWALASQRTKTRATTGEIENHYSAVGANYNYHVIPESDIKDAEKYREISKTEAEALWNKDYEASPKEVRERVHMITGTILPIWDRLPSSQAKIYRLNVDGKNIIGRVIDKGNLDHTLKKLGATRKASSYKPEDVFNNVLSHGFSYTLSNDWRIERRKVADDYRIEIKGASYSHIGELQKYGVFTERISYETRFFIPTEKQTGIAAIKEIISSRPVVDVTEAGKKAGQVTSKDVAFMNDTGQYRIVNHGTASIWAPEPGFPHGRPRLDKVGSGEGAAANGYGWYSAEAEAVARAYKDILSRTNNQRARLRRDGHNYIVEVQNPEDDEQFFVIGKNLLYSDAIELREEWNAKNAGSLYKLDIPDDVLPKLLDWDKPLSEQSEYVRKALDKALLKIDKQARQRILDNQSAASGAFIYSQLTIDLGSDKAASEYLRSIGIPGNKYLDQQSRAIRITEDQNTKRWGITNTPYIDFATKEEANKEADKDRTYNYVLWDQTIMDRVAMLERNGTVLDAIREAEKANAGDAFIPTLADVQGIFKGQDVQQNSDGSFLIGTAAGQVIVKGVDRIDVNPDRLQIGYSKAKLSDKDIVAGKYEAGEIQFVRGVGDKLTLAHESIHFMEDIGVLVPNEVNLLKRHIQGLAAAGKFNSVNKDDIGGKEDRANFLGKALIETPKGLIGRIVGKIQDFIDKLVNAFGIRTVKGVARDVKTGAIYNRPAAAQGAGRSYNVATMAEPFYSQLLNTVTTKLKEMPSKIQSIPKWLERNQVKPAEMKWMGVQQWLKENAKDGAIDKQKFADFLKANQIEIEEIEKGAVSESEIDIFLNDEAGEGFTREEARDYLENDEERTKFSQYVMPGGENYRELLLTLPVKETKNLQEWIKQNKRAISGENFPGQETFRGSHWDEPNVLAHVRMNDRTILTYTPEQIKNIGQRIIAALGKGTFDRLPTMGSLASGAPDVAVARKAITPLEAAQFSHYKGFRFNNQDGATARVLFIEEVQSDWHQEGKKKGYANGEPVRKPTRDEIAQEIYGKLYADLDTQTQSAVDGELDARINGAGGAAPATSAMGTIPPAPFAENWHEILMKRMLRYAAENGYDKIAWTTGEQQAERYDLSKYISEIYHTKNGNNYFVHAFDKNGNSVIDTTVPPKELEDIVGKEIAQKIVNGEGEISKGNDKLKVLSGLDLKVGGEGMKSFYDNLIPGFMRKYVAQWGAKIGESVINTKPLKVDEKNDSIQLAETETVPSVDITPQMKQDVLFKGQAYYSVKEHQDPPASNDPKGLNQYLKDETDAIVQTIMNKLHPKQMTWLETMLKSPEWFGHPAVQRIVSLFVRDRNELYHETFNHLNLADDIDAPENTVTEAGNALKGKGLSIVDRIAGKESAEYKMLARFIDHFDTSWKKDKNKTLAENMKACEDYMKKNGATEDVIKAWRLYRESYDKALVLLTRQMEELISRLKEQASFRGEEADVAELQQTLKFALAEMKQWEGFYAPRLREAGDWAVRAYKEHGPLAENREYYREHRGSELSAQRLAKKLAREGWKIASIGKVQKLPETVYQDVKAASAAKLIESAMSKLTGKDNAVVQFNQDVLQTVADEIRARGFRSSMIHRKQGEVIRGYIEDPVKRHLLYINNMAGGVSKAQVARMAMEELLGQQVMGKQVGGIDPVKDPEAYKTATDYIAEQLRNLDNSDRIIGIAKSIATFKFLGFNIRSLAVNMTALVTTAPAAIHQYAMGGKGSFAAIFKELGVAGKDFGGYMAGRKLQNMEEQTFLDEMRRKGWDDPQYTRDALGTISKTHSRAWATAMNSSMYLFGKSEQFNRGATILAAYRLARKQGLTVGDAKERAKDATDKAHGVYGKATMPMWAQGTNPAAKIGQMLYVYGKFSHNYLQMLYDMGLKKHNIKGAMFAFLSPLVVAGGAALPFKGAIFGLAGAILSLLGWDDDPEKWVWDQIREHLGTGAETVARHGLTGAAGVDISGSLSIGVGIPKNIMDLSGAIGGSLETFATAFDAARSGSASKAIEAALPTGLANPIKAYRESNEGISTKRNYPVWDESGKQLMPTGGESVQKAVGFRSARQAVLSERTWEGKQQQTDYQGKRNALYQRYRSFILSGSKDRATYMKFVVDVREYNKKVRDAGLINMVPLITSESLKSQIRRMNNPTKRERAILEQ